MGRGTAESGQRVRLWNRSGQNDRLGHALSPDHHRPTLPDLGSGRGGAASPFSPRSSSGPAILTPASVSGSQWPSLPEAGSTRKSTLSPPARNTSASCFENTGEK